MAETWNFCEGCGLYATTNVVLDKDLAIFRAKIPDDSGLINPVSITEPIDRLPKECEECIRLGFVCQAALTLTTSALI